MLLQRMVTQQAYRRAILTLLALAVAALLALTPSTGQGETLADLPLTITSTTSGAITYHPDGHPMWDRLAFNIVEGQEVTFRVTPNPNIPPADTPTLFLTTYCYCNWSAGFLSYTTKADNDASKVKHTVPNMRTHLEAIALPPDSLPIDLTIRGLRSSRLRHAGGQTFTPVGAHFGLNVYWQEHGSWVSNNVTGRIIVSERSHTTAEDMIRYVSIDNAAETVKGGTLTYQVRLTDKDHHPVTADQDIPLVINSTYDYSATYADPATPLVQHNVMIPMGASSAAVTVQSRADRPTRTVERVHLRAYLKEHPDGVTFRDRFGIYDATGKIVDGTRFRLGDLVYWGTEGSNMSVAFNVDGNTSVGEFVLRLGFQFMYGGQRSVYADHSDFVGGHSYYDCTVDPTRRGRHVMSLPLLEDNISDDRESFVMRLSLVSAPAGIRAIAGEPDGHSVDFAYGLILDRTNSWNAPSQTPDCVAAASSSSVPSSEPLQSPIRVSTNAISLNEGSSFSYDVALNSDPGDQTVTVQPVSLDEGTISTSASLSFTSANWNQPQAVVVTAESDTDSDDEQVGIGHIVVGVSGAPVGPVVFATVTEQPTVGLELRQPTQRSFGDQPFFAYWIRLDRQPASDVEIELSPAADSVSVQLHTSSLSFTTDNWDHYQIVVLKPLDSTVGSDLKVTHSASTHSINSGESVSATISGG